MTKQVIQSVLQSFFESLQKNTFVKAQLINKSDGLEMFKSIQIKLVEIKREKKVSFNYRFQRKDMIKNYSFDEAYEHIQRYINDLKVTSFKFFTLKVDVELRANKKREWKEYNTKPTFDALLPLSHDRKKNRKLENNKQTYLKELRILDKNGEVYKNAQDKFKQINHYIEVLSSMLKQLPPKEEIKVADMGSGKGYLTFALYDYLNNVLKKKSSVVGVEFRSDLVQLCNSIAQKSNFEHLKFVEGTIQNFEVDTLDVLVALHACDTATDDAIAKGIQKNATLIVVAPCCHKQVRREIEKAKPKNDLSCMIQYGTFLERQAEMLTDSIRALIMNYFGYTTKVLEFVSDSHTPKNVLVVGIKNKENYSKEKVLEEIKKQKAFFGIKEHALEALLSF